MNKPEPYAATTRADRVQLLHRQVDAIYDTLTQNRTKFLRVEELVDAASKQFPGLVPTREQIAAEEGFLQRDKTGLEIDQGLFLSAVLRSLRSGTHLCHAMLLPVAKAQELLPKFASDGVVELPGGHDRAARQGGDPRPTSNPRFLNAEDQTSLAGFETCVDLALLDPGIEVAVLRGGLVEHPKYAGKAYSSAPAST